MNIFYLSVPFFSGSLYEAIDRRSVARVFRFAAAAMLVLVFSPSFAVAAEKLLIMPFEMHSSVDIGGERRGAMSSLASGLDEAGAEIVGMEALKELVLREDKAIFTEAEAAELAASVGADFVLMGSVARLGVAFAADWRLFDVKAGRTVAFFYRSAGTAGGLSKKLKRSAPDVLAAMRRAVSARGVERSGIIGTITVTGLKRIDPMAVLKKVSSREGDEYLPELVRRDLREVYTMGFFDDVSVELTDGVRGKALDFVVKEKPFIKSVEYTGSDEVSDEHIDGVITLKENTVLDMVLVNEDAARIKDLYASKEFFFATVVPEVKSDDFGAHVTFVIEEGESAKVKSITFIGNEVFTDEDLKDEMETEERHSLSSFLGSGKYDEFLFERDLALIRQHYFKHGYLKARILDYRVLLSEDKKWFHITVAIDEGRRYRLASFDVRGEVIGEKSEILDKFEMEVGDVFNASILNKGVVAVRDIYGDEGYGSAMVRPLTAYNDEKGEVRLTLDLKKNDLVYIERIDIYGNRRTRDKVIRREIELSEGDLFSSTSIKRSTNNLRRLGFFEEVSITRSDGSAPDTVRLDVRVKETQTGNFNIGAGYSSTDKMIATMSIAQSNLFGTGLKLTVSGMVSATSDRYNLNVTEPWLFDKPLSAGFDLFDTSREYADFTTDTKGYGLRFGFPLYERTTRANFSYSHEEVSVSDVDLAASPFILEQAGERTVNRIRALVRYDSRNDAFFPTEGTKTHVSYELAGTFLGGTDFQEYEWEGITYRPIPWDLTFSLRGNYAHIQGLEGGGVPIYEKYYLGGMRSIRGFNSRTISPKDPVTGELIGGTQKVVVNAEVLIPFSKEKKFKGVLFYDRGNVFDGEINYRELRSSVGFGIRWFSPIGPLRIEWGKNLYPRKDEESSMWEFTVGTAF